MNNLSIWAAIIAVGVSVVTTIATTTYAVGSLGAMQQSITIYTGRVETQLGTIQQSIADIRRELVSIDVRLTRIEERLNSFDNRVTKLEKK